MYLNLKKNCSEALIFSLNVSAQVMNFIYLDIQVVESEDLTY